MSSYTQYSQAWLEEPSAIRIVLMQVQVYDVVAAVDKYLYISTHSYVTTDGTTAWMAVVRNNITLNETLTQDGTGAMTFGDIEIINSNGEWDAYLDQTKYIWSNKTIKIYYGDATWSCTNLTDVQAKFLTVFNGVIDDADSRNRTSFNIKIRDKLERLNTPLTEDKLGVYGTWAGGQQNIDAIKPVVFGEVFNITPMVADPAKLKYIFNNGPSDALVEIRDNGMPLKASVVVGPTLTTTVSGGAISVTAVSGGSNIVAGDQFYIIDAVSTPKAVFTANITSASANTATLTVNSLTSGTVSVGMTITGTGIPFSSTVTTKITGGSGSSFIITATSSTTPVNLTNLTGITITGVNTPAIYRVDTVTGGAAATGFLINPAVSITSTTPAVSIASAGSGYTTGGSKSTGLYGIGLTRTINAVDNSVGIFCLAYQPAGTITCSVRGINNSINLTTGALVTGTYSNTIASLIALIATQYGKASQRFTAADLDVINLPTAPTALTGVAIVDTANILAVCRQLANSVGAQIFITRAGTLQILRYGEGHSSSLAVTKITEDDILYNSLIISGRPGVFGAIKLGYAKNYTVQTGLVTSILPAHKETLAQDWLNLTLLDQDTIKLYSLSQDAVQMDTLLIDNAGAAIEAKRRLDFYKKQHIMYKFTGTTKMLGLKLGQTVTLVHSRFNLYNSNVFPYPRDISAWTGVGVGGPSPAVSKSSTLSRDTTVIDSPAGGVPLKMVVTDVDPYTRSYNASKWNLAPAVAGETWTLSMWVKASATTSATIYIFGANSAGSTTNIPGTYLDVTVRPYWRRISLTTTITDGSVANTTAAYVQIRLDGPDSGYISGSTSIRPEIWWEGIQLEKNSGSGVVGAGVSGQVISLSPNWTTGHVDVEVLI